MQEVGFFDDHDTVEAHGPKSHAAVEALKQAGSRDDCASAFRRVRVVAVPCF